MKRKVFLAVALVALMAVGAFAQTESDFEVTKQANRITITKYVGKGGAVTIPATIQGVPVTSIEYEAFAQSKITSVVIGASVTNIGDDVFMGCTSLTSATIGDSVTKIGGGIFDGCTSLTSVNIGSSVTSIGGGIINGCPKLTSVTFKGTIPANGILNNAFPGDLRAKYLAGGAGTYTRSGSGSASVWTKQGATTTQAPASQNAPESEFRVDKSNNEITIIQYLGKGGEVNIPPTIQGLPVARIGDRAFQAVNITAVTFPESLRTINLETFYSCILLTSVTFKRAGVALMPDSFPGDLRAKYLAGGAGTYTRPNGTSTTWTKK